LNTRNTDLFSRNVKSLLDAYRSQEDSDVDGEDE
jgi:hypothetical protein